MGADEVLGGRASGQGEGGGPKSDDGFTRSVERLKTVLDSGFSRIDIIGVEVDTVAGF